MKKSRMKCCLRLFRRFFFKTYYCMKTTKKGQSKLAHPVPGANGRRQNKDDIDSRTGEEQLFKGDDVTHNRKEKQHLRKNLKRL